MILKIILASSSPRRRDILKEFGYKFDVVVSPVDESLNPKYSVEKNCKEIALKKCLAVANEDNMDSVIVSCDTMVVLNNDIFGKPKDKHDAFRMLKELSGKTHDVISGVAIKAGLKISNFIDVTKVTFKELSDREIKDYIDSEECFGKAGAYAIQGHGSDFVKKYDGDLYTVIGLPISKVKPILDSLIGE